MLRTDRSGLTGTLLIFLLLGVPASGDEPHVDFQKEIAPLLEQHCVACHQPGIRKGEFSLTTAAELKESGYVVPGKPAESYLLELITPAQPGQKPQMPKSGMPLNEEQRKLISRWIEQGADWPAELVLREPSKADQTWWSLQPLAKTPLPSPEGVPAAWRQNPIDLFIFEKLKEQGIQPSLPADKRTLLRRVTYDLTGLPPTPEELQAFLQDDSPEDYEKVVDRLLASPRYGEHWARHWLDVIRFGESRGYERNEIILNAWPFRDYVIRSLNEDKPFDQLTREHLAGDVLAPENPAVSVGTTFLVCGPYDDVGNQDAVQAAQIRANTIDDLIRGTGEAFLGITIGCARCHDHKFDPILQEDYYSWYSTFAGVFHGSREVASPEQRQAREQTLQPLREQHARLTAEKAALETAIKGRLPAEPTSEEQQKLAALNAELAKLNQQIAAVPPLPSWWVGNFHQQPQSFHVFIGGDPQKRGQEVVPASLSVLESFQGHYELPANANEGQRRLALANWIVHPANPLTPRVLANRLWQYHFGTGIVETPSDFGYMGGRPTHPELLDWLAGQLHENGWRWKPLHRQIVLSQTYRQASTFREDAASKDGTSRLLWRFPPRRLAAEEIRDSLLQVSGKLNLEMGGPGFRLYQYLQDNVATYVPLEKHGPETYRRGIYHHNARASLLDLLTDFDCPDNAFSAPKRASTITPLQALTLMNHSFTVDLAGFWAERLRQESGNDPSGQIDRAFQLAFLRGPSATELAAAEKLVQQFGLPALCRALMNSNEFIFID